MFDNQISSFAKAPTVSMPRSRGPLKQRVWSSFNTGELVPLFVYPDVLPGDTFNMSYSMVVRQTTSLKPTMDDAFIDIFGFVIPWRIIWKHTKEFMGENTKGPWAQTTEYLIPQLTTPTGGMNKGTIAEKMGVPIGKAGVPFSALGVRSYIITYNEHFRDQNLIAPVTQYDDDTDREASNTVSALGGPLLKVAKYHDYFTSCLPSAQKAEKPVTLPIGQKAPILSDGYALKFSDGTNNNVYIGSGNSQSVGIYGIRPEPQTGITPPEPVPVGYGLDLQSGMGNVPAANKAFGYAGQGLIADLSNAVAATINAQRQAFALQRIYEKDARGGTRYRELVKQHFGVTSPDARQQVPEYLFGKHIPLNLVQVAQTSEGTASSPQGNLAAYGHTSGAYKGFTKSFTEHSVILVLGAVRTAHSYSQGLNRMWSRRRRFDLYWPSLAHLGEQAVLNKEIFVTGTDKDNETFGFQERWAEYRYLPDLVTGAFRPDYAQSLDNWIYTDDYENTPVLSQEWIEETTANMDRTLAVQSSVEDQFIANFMFKIDATRPLPRYSVPGLIDHY